MADDQLATLSVTDPTKPAYLSKTIWMNVLAALASLYPPASAYIADHPTYVMLAFAAVNLVLRAVTKDKLSLS